MRPGIGRNASCASGDCLTSRPKGCSRPREFSIYSWYHSATLHEAVHLVFTHTHPPSHVHIMKGMMYSSMTYSRLQGISVLYMVHTVTFMSACCALRYYVLRTHIKWIQVRPNHSLLVTNGSLGKFLCINVTV